MMPRAGFQYADSSHGLLREVERQLEVAGPSSLELDASQEVSQSSKSVEHLSEQNHDYCHQLRILRDAIINESSSPRATTRLPDDSLLWKIPAFCRYPGSYIVPEHRREQWRSLQNLHMQRQSQVDTDEIWKDPRLQEWACSPISSLLLLQGRVSTRYRVERFGLEMLDYIEEHRQIATHMLKDIGVGESRDSLIHLDTLEVLRQVSIQLLTKSHIPNPLQYLAQILEYFQMASTLEGWVDVIKRILGPFCTVFLVIDLRVFGSNDAESKTKVVNFQRDIYRLFEKSTRTIFKLVLLNHYFDYQVPEKAYTVLVKGSDHLRSKDNIVLRQLDRRQSDRFRPRLCGLIKGLSLGGEVPAEGELSVTDGLERLDHRESTCTPVRPETRESFRIAIICALTLEADSVTALFDRHWENNGLPFEKAPGDSNSYTPGTIGTHNVILVHMSGMGKASAATAATNCRVGFPNLGLILVVGVCGGVPFKPNGDEIILGDVVIGDGVIQFDLGRQLPDRFRRKDGLSDILGRPDPALRALLAKLRGLRGGDCLRSKMRDHLQTLSADSRLEAIYPGSHTDKLFEATYHHSGNQNSCEQAGCSGKLVQRQRHQKQQPEPEIHFGFIASGDRVMRSGEERDAIARDEGVIAFEMEGAGVWDTGTCVIIKGVCDYADSHKSKAWQRYAAATAASCMKAFLSYWAPA